MPGQGPGSHRTGEADGGLASLLAATWRETPLSRQWRKCRQPNLARGWRKRYRWFRWPVACLKPRARAGIRYTQTEPPRETDRSRKPAIDDSRPLRVEGPRGYRGTPTLPRGPGPWPTPPAGTATAAPTPALTAARAPRESWPAPSTRTSADGARSFLQGKGHFHGDQDPLPTTLQVNSACSGSPDHSVTRCNAMRKMADCWTCGRTIWVWRIRERNFCSGKCRVRHHRSAYRKPGPSTSGGTSAGTG